VVALTRRGRGATDLRLDQNVVRPADHDQMFDIVAPDKHQLPLPIEAERVDQPEPRLADPSARNAQPMGESQPVENRDHDQGGDAASRKESDLKDPVVRERKLIQPLHAQSKTSDAERARTRFSSSPAERRFRLRIRSTLARSETVRRGPPPVRAPRILFGARPCHIS
jgi:hypothetical protein